MSEKRQFDLYVTTAKGRKFRTLNSPYPTREAMTRTVCMVLADHGRISRKFAQQVVTAPLGETVTHPESGKSFRIEAAKEGGS